MMNIISKFEFIHNIKEFNKTGFLWNQKQLTSSSTQDIKMERNNENNWGLYLQRFYLFVIIILTQYKNGKAGLLADQRPSWEDSNDHVVSWNSLLNDHLQQRNPTKMV